MFMRMIHLRYSMSEENTFKTENIKHERNVGASGIFYCLKEFTFLLFIKLYKSEIRY